MEEWELILPHSEFRKLIAIRPPENISNYRSYEGGFISEVRAKSQSTKNLAPFLGYYYNHFIAKQKESMIQRSLVCLFDDPTWEQGLLKEFLMLVGLRPLRNMTALLIILVTGFIYLSRKACLNKQSGTPHFMPRQLEGARLGVGNTTASVQDISCYRSIFQFLGRTIDKYDALKGCGLYEPNSPEIPAYIREHIENRIEPGDNAFVAA